jgi:hypothetical protein
VIRVGGGVRFFVGFSENDCCGVFPEVWEVSYVQACIEESYQDFLQNKLSPLYYLVRDIIVAFHLFFCNTVDDLLNLGGGYLWEVERGIKRKRLDVIHGDADWDI